MTQPLTKRQRELLDYLTEFIGQNGYAPTFVEIGRRFGFTSLATIHKHLSALEAKGYIRRDWNRVRAIELIPPREPGRTVDLPLLGTIAAGLPIEAVEERTTLQVPHEMIGRLPTYVLRVKGDSMIEEQIRDGDWVIIESRDQANDGEMVVALLDNSEATLKKFYREGDKVRLQPANMTLEPIRVPAERVRVQGVVIGLLRRY